MVAIRLVVCGFSFSVTSMIFLKEFLPGQGSYSSWINLQLLLIHKSGRLFPLSECESDFLFRKSEARAGFTQSLIFHLACFAIHANEFAITNDVIIHSAL